MTATCHVERTGVLRAQTRTTRRPTNDAVLWAALMVPYLVVAAPWYGSSWFPIQDHAVLDMRIADLWSGEPPLLGAFSRYGWSHPGPVWFYALAPFRMLGGGASWMVVGSVVLFGAGFATTAVVARRRFGTAACLGAVVAGTAASGGGGTFALLVPWNPNLAFAWFGLFLVLCVSAASVDRSSNSLPPPGSADLFAAGFVGSALVQLHVGYVILVAAPLAVACSLTLAGSSGSIRERMASLFAGRAARWWTAAVVLLWAPPLLDQLANGRDGNVWRLVHFFVRGEPGVDGPTGWRFALGILGEVTRLPLIGYGGTGEPTAPNSGDIVPGSPALILPLAVLLAVAAALTFRRPFGERGRAVLVAIAAVVSALVAGARIVGDRWPYLFVWRYPVVWFTITVAVVVLVGSFTRTSRFSGRVPVLLLAAAVVLAGSTTIHRGRAWPADEELRPLESSTRLLTDQLLAGAPPDGPVTLVRFGAILRGVGDGVLRVVDREEWPVGMTEDLDFKYGAHRVVALGDARSVWLVTETSSDTTVAEMVPGGLTLAKVTPLEPSAERRLVELQRRAIRVLHERGRLDLRPTVGSSVVAFTFARAGLDLGPGVLDELGALNAQVEDSSMCRCTVVEVPVDTPHFPDVALEAVVGGGGP